MSIIDIPGSNTIGPQKDFSQLIVQTKEWLKKATREALQENKALFFAFFETLFDKAHKVRGYNNNSPKTTDQPMISLKEIPYEK